MNNLTLAQSYLLKAKARLKTLNVLYEEGAFSDVVREAQEIGIALPYARVMFTTTTPYSRTRRTEWRFT